MDIKFVGEAETRSTATDAVDTDGTFMVYAIPRTAAVEVVILRNMSSKPVRLASEVQTRPIHAVCLGVGVLGTSDPSPYQRGPADSALLFTASKDAIAAWNLAAVYAALADNLPLAPPIQVMANPGACDALVYSGELCYLVACAGTDVHVFDTRTFRHVYRLEGHAAPVLTAAFCDAPRESLLVTAGEDRTFKVWDLGEGSLVYQSAILCAAPLTALAMDPSFPRMALGAADGVVRFFDLASLPAVRTLQATDVGKAVNRIWDTQQAALQAVASAAPGAGPKVISSKPSWKEQAAQEDQPEDEVTGSFVASNNACIVRLFYCPLRPPILEVQTYQDEQLGPSLLAEQPKLLIATPRALCVLDTHAYEVTEAYFLGGPAPALGNESGSAMEILQRQRSAAMQDVGYGGRAVNLGMAAGSGRRGAYRAIPEAEQCFLCACAVGEDCEPNQPPSNQGSEDGSAEGEGASSSERLCVYVCAAAAYGSSIAVLRARPAQQLDTAVLAAEGGTGALSLAERGRCGSASTGADLAGPGPRSAAAAAAVALPISVFQLCTLPEDSPLRLTSIGTAANAISQSSMSGMGGARRPSPTPSPSKPGLASPSSSMRSRTGSASSSSKSGLVNQPVTFHKKVKSSGYGFVQPQVKMGRAPAAPVKLGKAQASSTLSKQLMQAKSYPVGCGPLIQHQPKNSLPSNTPVHHGAITAIAFSSDASRLLTASADKTARVMKLPLSRYAGEGTDLLGHNAHVLAADWSHDGTMVLTASADRTARLWNAACAQPLLEFSHLDKQVSKSPQAQAAAAGATPPRPSAAAAPAASNPAYLHEVRCARFFYLDQFILLATGNKLCLYRYKLCEEPDDDIERLRSKHKYRLAASYASSAQAVSTFSAVNAFLSPLALLAGSNKAVEVLDVTTMQCVLSIDDAHARPMHTIVQAHNSAFTSHPREAYELFATAAPDNTAKLWDVRSARCVRTFSGHKNSQVQVGCTFSPCLRYLATGSEDKVAYVYDLRQGSVLHRLRGVHGDTVTGVAFNPLHPQLATACLDGKVHFFSE